MSIFITCDVLPLQIPNYSPIKKKNEGKDALRI